MKAEILKQLERKAGVNAADYDCINSHFNESSTKVITRFYVMEVVGGVRTFLEVGFASTLLNGILNREEDYEDYLSNGIEDRCYMKLN